MFPGVTLPSIGDERRLAEIMCGSSSELIANLGYVYASGLSEQFVAICRFTASLIDDLESDFAKLEHRMDAVRCRFQALKQVSAVFMSRPVSTAHYTSAPAQKVALPALDRLKTSMPGQGTSFVDSASVNCDPPISLAPFARVCPGWREADQLISNLGFYERQLHVELAAELAKAMDDHHRPVAAHRSSPAIQSTDSRSAAALKNYLEDLPVPSQRIALAPPAGQTAKWRTAFQYRSVVVGKPRKADRPSVAVQTEMELGSSGLSVFETLPAYGDDIELLADSEPFVFESLNEEVTPSETPPSDAPVVVPQRGRVIDQSAASQVAVPSSGTSVQRRHETRPTPPLYILPPSSPLPPPPSPPPLPPPPRQKVSSMPVLPRNFLEDIRNKNYKLRRKADWRPLADKPVASQQAVMDLSTADLQVALQNVREATQFSDDSDEESSSSSSTSW
jgi:hypothetical protein